LQAVGWNSLIAVWLAREYRSGGLRPALLWLPRSRQACRRLSTIVTYALLRRPPGKAMRCSQSSRLHNRRHQSRRVRGRPADDGLGCPSFGLWLARRRRALVGLLLLTTPMFPSSASPDRFGAQQVSTRGLYFSLDD
jgi:hypothetical protein